MLTTLKWILTWISTRGRVVSREKSATSEQGSSNFSKSSVDYTERMEPQSWMNQMEVEDEIAFPYLVTQGIPKTQDNNVDTLCPQMMM